MKIATWNIERLKHKSKLTSIISVIEEINADILVLTESDSRISLPNYKYRFDSQKIAEIDAENYLNTEKRISIFTNYKKLKQLPTYD